MIAFQVLVSLISVYLVGFGSAAISPISQHQSQDNSVTEEPWAPATEPRDFSYNVLDGIQGANQLRQESWKNGTMRGMYSFPLGDNKWQVVTYVADDKGYRVESTKIISEAELMNGHKPDVDTANVDISQDGEKTAYKVKAGDIAPKEHEKVSKDHEKVSSATSSKKTRRGVYEAQEEAAKASLR